MDIEQPKAEQVFIEWFVRNYPQDTHIYDPNWHAGRIFRVACVALKDALEAPRAARPEGKP